MNKASLHPPTPVLVSSSQGSHSMGFTLPMAPGYMIWWDWVSRVPLLCQGCFQVT